MKLNHTAIAGTLESSDAQITVSPSSGGIKLLLESTVMREFGRQIKETVLRTLEKNGVSDCEITVVDHGALECTLEARVECAIYRAADQFENLPWR